MFHSPVEPLKRSTRESCSTIVEVQQPAETWTATNPAINPRWRRAVNQLLAEALMIPFLMVVVPANHDLIDSLGVVFPHRVSLRGGTIVILEKSHAALEPQVDEDRAVGDAVHGAGGGQRNRGTELPCAGNVLIRKPVGKRQKSKANFLTFDFS
jgi:hypothetical protein